MDSTKLYAIAAASAILIWIFFRALAWLLRILKFILVIFVARHLLYPLLYRRRRFFGAPTRFQALSTAMYVTANVASLVLGTKSASQVGLRAGIMASINLLVLLVGPRLSLVADYLGISCRANLQIHCCVGRMTIIHAVIHVVLALVLSKHVSRLNADSLIVSIYLHMPEKLCAD
jgi:hypothetical protein